MRIGSSICRSTRSRKTAAFGSTASARTGCPPSPETASPMSEPPAADRPPHRQSKLPCGVYRMLTLYQPPPARHVGQRGRTPKYGAKMTEQAVATLKETRSFLFLYGQGQIVRYRSAVVLAKFLGGRAVRAVWIRLEDENGLPKAPRLLIATEITMTAREIIDAYALRWTIEPM